jgi:hypothetical protein
MHLFDPMFLTKLAGASRGTNPAAQPRAGIAAACQGHHDDNIIHAEARHDSAPMRLRQRRTGRRFNRILSPDSIAAQPPQCIFILNTIFRPTPDKPVCRVYE